MTLGQLILCASPLPNNGILTVADHLNAMTCDFVGGAVTVNGEILSLHEDITLISDVSSESIFDEKMDIIYIDDIEIKIDEGDILDGIQ